MNSRWARIALILGSILGVLAGVCAIRMILKPQLPVLVQLLTVAVESVVLLRGAYIMYHPASSRSRRGGSAWLAVFLAVILFGSISCIVLTQQRPYLSSQQRTDSISEPVVDNRWADFEVRYPDNYYLDLQIDAKAPLTFKIVNEEGEAVYSETGTRISKDGFRIKLARGQYWFSMTCEAGFAVKCSIE